MSAIKRRKPPKIDDPALAALRKELSQYGSVFLQPAEDTDYPFDLRRPTGLIGLDMEIGGGWPAGSLNQLFGPDASGKNAVANWTIAEVQRNYGDDARICVVSMGYGYDKSQARSCGVAIRHSKKEISQIEKQLEKAGMEMTQELYDDLIFQPGVFEIIELNALTMTAEETPTEKLLSAVLDAIASDVFQLIVVDEAIGALATKDTLSKSLADNAKMADQANLLTQMVRKFFTVIKARPKGRANETTVILIAQTRMKLNPYEKGTGGQYSLTGGQAVKHAKALDIHINSGETLLKSKKRIGKELKWKVAKAKLGTYEGATGSLPLLFTHENMHDPIADLVSAAKDAKLIGLAGSWHFLMPIEGYDSDKYEEHKSFDVPVIKLGMGLNGAHKAVAEDPELAEVLAKALLSKIKRFWRVT